MSTPRPKKKSRAGNPLRVFPETLTEMQRLQSALRTRGLTLLPARLYVPGEEVTLPVVARMAVTLLADLVAKAESKKRGGIEVPPELG